MNPRQRTIVMRQQAIIKKAVLHLSTTHVDGLYHQLNHNEACNLLACCQGCYTPCEMNYCTPCFERTMGVMQSFDPIEDDGPKDLKET